ncbi:MAG: hypothetical protein ABFQ89_02505 [Chloroflexota bacterium]
MTRQYPVFVLCGRDKERRELMKVHDPDGTVKVKALLPFLGRRVIDWQLDALAASPFISSIYLLGLSQEDYETDLPVQYIPCPLVSDVSQKLVIGLEYLNSRGENPDMIVISSSDSPAVRTEEVDLFLSQLVKYKEYDFILSLVPEHIGEQEFPKSGRVVGRFVDHCVHPGELYVLNPSAIREGEKVIEELGRRRRKIDRQAERISIAPMVRFIARRPKAWFKLLKFILGMAALHDAEIAFGRAFNCKVKGIIIPDAGFGMDMDLPQDYDRLAEYVGRQISAGKMRSS